MKLQNLQRIIGEECCKLRAVASNAEQFYGLPKVHKEGVPLKLIGSLPGTPNHRLAKKIVETSETTDKWTLRDQRSSVFGYPKRGYSGKRRSDGLI